jgi:phosphatidylglycerophosphatase A
VGLAPVAPGTAGSALAIPIFVLFSLLEPRALALGALGLACAVLFGAGTWAGGRLVAASGVDDDQRIVLDEVVGQLVTLAPLLAWPGWSLRAGGAAAWLAVVTGFVAFRVFDVWKPGPVRAADERVPGGLGVMLDDLVAGALGALALTALLALAAALRGGEAA